MKNPIQPLAKDEHGVLRFKSNKIVEAILEHSQRHRYGLNEIACDDFTIDDREQFAQLIGYSLSGFGDLSYVTNYTYEVAESMTNAANTDQRDLKIAYLEGELKSIRESLKKPIARMYGIHPDDLVGE